MYYVFKIFYLCVFMLFYLGFSQGCEKNARCFWVSDGIRPKGQTLFYCRMASDVINEGLILFLLYCS